MTHKPIEDFPSLTNYIRRHDALMGCSPTAVLVSPDTFKRICKHLGCGDYGHRLTVMGVEVFKRNW